MSSRYAYALRERAALAILAADDAELRELLRLFDRLAKTPSQTGVEQVIDETGRTNEIVYSSHYRVVYWADHASKEVRIMDVRRY
ncbi:MAG: hypothetical protein JSS11_16240 [Verrucomicrobia bacterium]|nr:hypothetical protein [Verrucomicrobiota bacterium]